MLTEQNLNGNRYGVILVTASSQEEGEALAQALLEANLAACVSITPIRSLYRWQGKLCREEEWQLIIKTDLAKFADLEQKVRTLHSYEVPEIIAVPILAGSSAYLEWITEQTTLP